MRCAAIQFMTVSLCLGTCSTIIEPGSARGQEVLSLPRVDPLRKSSPVDQREFSAERVARMRNESRRSLFAVVRRGAETYGVLNVEFNSDDSCRKFADHPVPDSALLTRFGRFADVLVPNDQVWKDVEQVEGVVWTELAQTGNAPPPPIGVSRERRGSAPEPEKVVRGGTQGLKGAGTIIAVIDTGVDFHNPDFIRYDSDGNPVSRLLFFWDTLAEFRDDGVGTKAPVQYPTGVPIGAVYSRDELSRELRSSKPRIQTWDTDGHGTACLGIAGGNGNSSPEGKYAGVAPEADLIAVRIGTGQGGLENAFLLGCILEWLDSKAGSKPMVVSCSFGGSRTHDGTSIEERHIDARFPLTAKGRAICAAAGNDGRVPHYGEIKIAGQDRPGILRWMSPQGASIWVFLPVDSYEGIQFSYNSPLGLGTRAVPNPPSNGFIIASAGPFGETGMLQIDGYFNPLSKTYVLQLRSAPGPGELRFWRPGGKEIVADAYIRGNADPYSGLMPTFDNANLPRALKQIESPGAAANAITVGSYDFNDQFDHFGQLDTVGVHDRSYNVVPMEFGSLSAYSNPGYSRIDSITKPDIVAPGQWFIASAARNTFALRDSTGHYRLFNGTSAATPYTAGVLALVMQRNPTIPLGRIKELLRQCATHDGQTNSMRTPEWGFGKLDLTAVNKMIAQCSSASP